MLMVLISAYHFEKSGAWIMDTVVVSRFCIAAVVNAVQAMDRVMYVLV